MPLSFREKRTLIKLLVISSRHVQHCTSWMEGKHLKALGPRGGLGFSGPNMKLLWKNHKLRWCKCPSGLCTFVFSSIWFRTLNINPCIDLSMTMYICNFHWLPLTKSLKATLETPSGLQYTYHFLHLIVKELFFCNTIKCFFSLHDQG